MAHNRTEANVLVCCMMRHPSHGTVLTGPLLSATYLITFTRDDADHISYRIFEDDFIHCHGDCNRVFLRGPCNGLYCFCGSSIWIVNPSIREFRTLPDIPENPPFESASVKRYTGFGFDPSNNDYKLVVIREDNAEPVKRHVGIYSLRTDSWRSIDSLPSDIHMLGWEWSNTFVGGACHWLAHGDDDGGGIFLLAFNFSSETFSKIMLPDAKREPMYWGSVTNFWGCLAVLLCLSGEIEMFCELWVMREYGKGDSWTMELIIGPMVGVRRTLEFLDRKGLFVFEDQDNRLVFHNIQTGETTRSGFGVENDYIQAAAYQESLVSLHRENEPASIVARLSLCRVDGFVNFFEDE